MRFRTLMTLVPLFLLGSLTAGSIIPRAAAKDTYKALYDFASQATSEVDLQKGEVVTVLQQDSSGWWLVEKPDGSAQGWTPASYLSKVSSGPSPSLKTVSSSTTTNKRSSTSKSSSSSSTKTSVLSTSTAIVRSSTSSRPSSSSRLSTSSARSTSSLTSSTSSSSASSSPRPSSTKRSISSSSTHVDPFVLPVPTSRSSSPFLSPSSARASAQGLIKAIGTAANTISTSSRVSLLSAASANASNIASTNAPINSSTTLSVSVPVTSSLLSPTNISIADLYRMAGFAPSLNNNSSFPMQTGPRSTPTPTNNSSDCIVDCDTITSSPKPTSSSEDCLVNCDSSTSSPIPTSSPVDCLVNCNPANSSLLVNATSQSSPKNFSNAAVPPECADPGGVNGVTTACWNAMDMSQYIFDWMLSHQGVCQAKTSFAQCFLQVLDTGMDDCVGISSGTCPPPSWIQFKDHNMSVQDFYVAYNIYAVWTFFNSYYLAIGNARSAATDSVAAIVSLLNPPKTNDAELSNINFALGIGLTFLKIEGFVSPVVEALVGVVVNAAKQVPQVVRYLFPGPPGDTKFVQLGQISNQMGTLTDNLQNNVATALSVIQNDTNTFLSFTGTGAFSNNPVVRMNQQSNSLLTALNTYVISLCLQANNWQISRAIDTDINQLMANGTNLTWNVPECGTGYDHNSICGGYYWNKTIGVSYTLTNTDDMFRNPAPIMQQFFANWTTPQLLFDGALQCQMAKGTGSPNISPTAGTDDVTSTPCLSSVKICTWDLNPSHFGTQYEYTDCDVQSNFATQGCTQCDATTDFCISVPSSYLGGYLLNPKAKGPQYVYCDDGHTLIQTN